MDKTSFDSREDMKTITGTSLKETIKSDYFSV